MIVIDGSKEEGGGAMLRQSLALSIMTGKPFRIKNIRKNRPKPGLKAQHLKSVELAREVCNAKVTGAHYGSEVLEFFPGEMKNANGVIDIGTAGSITLALQSVFIPMVFSGKSYHFKLIGGTDVKWSPPIDYFKDVFAHYFEGYADIKIHVFRKGYYPKGKGIVKISVKSKAKLEDAKPVFLEKPKSLVGIKGVCHASKDLESSSACEKMREAASMLLKDFDVDTTIVSSYYDSESTGGGISFYGMTACGEEVPCRVGSNALLDEKLDFEKTAGESVSFFKETMISGSGCDLHLADQLIPLLAFSTGRIKTSSITGHVKGNIHVAEIFTGKKFKLYKEKGIISCL